jgi:P-type conjugative transfer protein TrbL
MGSSVIYSRSFMPNLPIHHRHMLQLALFLVLGIVSTSVLAQDAHGQLVTSLVDLFAKGNTSWAAKIQAAAGQLFWSLALISVVWNFGALLLRRADISEFFFEILSFIFFTGLFYWFLTNTFIGNGNSDDLVNAIVNSFKQMAPDGVGDLRQSADNIVQIGLNIYYQVLKQSGSQNWTDGDLLLVGITVLLVVIALSMVVAQIALVLIMAWMLAYGGIFLLGFGGARWTSLIAISYLKHVVAVGVALLALNLLVYFGRDILDQLSSGLTGGDAVQYEQLADMLVVSLIMMVLAYKVPSLLYSLVTSSPLGLMAGTASMTSNAVAAGSRAIYNTAYNTAAQAISHYRSSETTYHRQAGEPDSIRAQHVTVIDALRDAAGIQAGTETVYKPVDVSGQSGSRTDDDSSSGKEDGSVFGDNTPQTAWPGERPSQASPLAQAMSSTQNGDGGKGAEKGQGGQDALGKSASATIGTTASSQEQVGGAGGQGGSAFGSAPGPSLTSSGGGGMGVGAGGPVTATVSGGGGGGFQPPTVNATVSASPSNSLSSPNLLGGGGASGSVGGAVSKAAAGLQDGPSLGAAPRQSSRKIDDTTGLVGRRDKQQERALKEQEKTAKQEPERRKDGNEKTRENSKPVPPTDSKPSAPTDDEVNAFRDRRPDADFNQDDADR